MTSGDVIHQLSRNRDILSSLFAGIPYEDASWKPDRERWSGLEIVNHLADIEVEDFRTDLDIILHHPKAPWPSFDIHSWVLERRYNEGNFAVSVGRFLRERKASLEWLASLGEINQNARHSGNGYRGTPLRAGDILSSWIAHDLFHIRQMSLLQWDLLQRKSEPYSPDYSGFEP